MKIMNLSFTNLNDNNNIKSNNSNSNIIKKASVSKHLFLFAKACQLICMYLKIFFVINIVITYCFFGAFYSRCQTF